MNTYLTILFLMVPLADVSAAQSNPAGTWRGEWIRDGSVLEVDVTFDSTESGYVGAFGSDQLRVVGIPFRNIALDDSRMTWELVGDFSTTFFEGTLRGDTLAGEFRDGDAVGSFRLTRSSREVARLEEKDVTFTNGDVTLGGTVLFPDGLGPFAGVVFLHGSGPEGRWASRFLANALARRGIASLIYDKRGVGASTGDWRDAGFEDLVADTRAAIEALRSQPRIAPDLVGIHGHSQGGTLAPRVAAENPHVAFVVASAGGGLSMAETEIFSLQNSVDIDELSHADSVLADRYIRAVVAAAYYGAPRAEASVAWEAVRDQPWAFDLPPENHHYWSFSRRIADYDAPGYWRRVSVPAMLLYGEGDERVPPRESAASIAAAYLGAGGPALEVILFPGADHTFRVRDADTQGFQWPRSVSGYPDRMIEWIIRTTNP